jgi:hypothetical protein
MTDQHAFPNLSEHGLTKREWFAGQALAGLLAHASGEAPQAAPRLAWVLADAMIAEIAKAEGAAK